MSPSSLPVTVIIPCYNGRDFLRETLESVLAQTTAPREVLVVDDGSTDDSAAIAESYGPPVRVIRQRNQGESVARNRGIEEAVSEWVAFLDADDLWRPEKLAAQWEMVDDSTVAAHTNYYTFGATDGEWDWRDYPEEERYRVEFIAQGYSLHPSTMLVRRSVSPRFPAWTQHAEDLVYMLELVQRGPIRLVPESLVGYRRHAQNQSARAGIPELRWHATVETWLAEHAPDLPEERKQAIRSTWLQRLAAMASDARWKRDWPRYWEIRRRLAPFAGADELTSLLTEKIHPAWTYRVKDFVDRLRGAVK